MAGLYSSQSGKYADFVTGKELTTAVKHQTDKQIQMQMISTSMITENQNSNAKALQYTINKQTYALLASQAAMTRTFAAGFNAVNNTLTVGFDSVNASISNLAIGMAAGMRNIEQSIEKMSAEICDRLDALHDIMNNPRRTQARELYRSAAKNAKSGLFEESLDDLKQAVEKEKTDYLSWLLKGQVEVYGCGEFGNVVNVDDALESLMNAYKYVSADLATMTDGKEDAQKIAADICYHLAYAEYIRSNDFRLEENSAGCEEILEKSIEHYEKSLSFEKRDITEYQLARCQHLAGQNISSMAQLRSLVAHKETKDYAFKVLIDPDFMDFHEEMMKTIDEVRKEKYKEALTEKEKFVKKYGELCFYKRPEEIEKLEDIKKEVIADDKSLFEYYEIMNNYLEQADRYKKMMEQTETISITQKDIVSDVLYIGFCYSDFYKYRDSYIYAEYVESKPEYGGDGKSKLLNIWMIGDADFYTENRNIYPCFNAKNKPREIMEAEEANSLSEYVNSEFVYSDIIIKVPCCSFPKTPTGQIQREICGIKQFSPYENKIPDMFSPEWHKESEEEREREKKIEAEKSKRRTAITVIAFIALAIFSIIKCKNG